MNILDLPYDVLCLIAENSFKYPDLVHLSQVSKDFHEVATSTEVWEKTAKLYQVLCKKYPHKFVGKWQPRFKDVNVLKDYDLFHGSDLYWIVQLITDGRKYPTRTLVSGDTISTLYMDKVVKTCKNEFPNKDLQITIWYTCTAFEGVEYTIDFSPVLNHVA